MHPNAQLIETFYGAFAARDGVAMGRCYHPDIHFSDEVFPDLQGAAAGAMWQMLTARAQGLTLVVDGIAADDSAGQAHWIATYPFSKTGRTVVNDIHARFVFRDGLIVRHVDHFDFWKWSRMALGTPGLLLGWSPVLRHKVQREAARSLAEWMAKGSVLAPQAPVTTA